MTKTILTGFLRHDVVPTHFYKIYYLPELRKKLKSLLLLVHILTG